METLPKETQAKNAVVNVHGVFREDSRGGIEASPGIIPNTWNLTNNPLHALIGSPVLNPSPVKLFRSVVGLQQLGYLKDHSLGKHAIFSGGCYMEMIMAAGIAVTLFCEDSLPSAIHPFQVKDLVIKTPLLLNDHTPAELQTVLQFKNTGDCDGLMTVQIYSRVGKDRSALAWRYHVDAKFYPFVSAKDSAVPIDTVVKFKEMLEHHGSEELPAEYFRHMETKGLAFGPAYRNLEKVWIRPGHSSMLTKIQSPLKDEELTHYIIHPVVIDAIAQCSLLLRYALMGVLKMLVSVKIGKFVWLGKYRMDGEFYAYTYDAQNKKGADTATSSYVSILLNGNGEPLAVMSGLECVYTTISRIEAALEYQTKPTPDMWKEVWQPSPRPNQNQRDAAVSANVPVWLLFHQEDSSMSNFLFTEMSKKGICVLGVTHSEKKVILENSSSIRRNSEADFAGLFDHVLNEKRSIDGIIYCWTLDHEVSLQEEILLPYFLLVKSLTSSNHTGTICLISLFKGTSTLENRPPASLHQSTVWGFARAVQSEHPDLKCLCLDIGDAEEDASRGEQILWEILEFVEGKGSIHVAYQGGVRYVPQFQAYNHVANELRIPPGTDRFKLALPESGRFDELHFVPMAKEVIEDNEVEVHVKAVSINFWDIMMDQKPCEEFSKIDDIAMDISGIIERVGARVTKWSLGDHVFGQNIQRSLLPSHIVLHEDDVYESEKEMNWCEVVTLPIDFLTAYMGLVEIAKIRKGDTVLVHSDTGGVGLCAMQICKNIGAKVICIAGSDRKKNFLKSLGVEHIFNSRNTNYSKEILEVTGGHGVDVVLNSLTSEGFKEATLMTCALSARFVEMSKFNVWMPEEVRQLRPDVDYKVIDVSVEGLEVSHRRKIFKVLVEYIKEKKVAPLPYQRFDGINIREALHFLQKAKHIGKVVCVMPELSPKNGIYEVETPIFHRQGTYLITGGRVGSIGFEVCRWMLEKGAKYVFLLTRTAPSESAQQIISKLNTKFSSNIISVQVDLGDYSQLEELVQRKLPQMGFPQLKGVMHCAGAISDGLVQNQSWSSLRVPLRAKVDGTLNLHRVASGMNLEHFVIFSSLAALFGLPGQSNHGAANNFEDVFAHYRHSLGLPATSINWGLWAEVGNGKEVEIPGLKPMSSKQGILGLEYALKSHRAQIAIANFDSFLFLSKRTPWVSMYLDESLWKPKGNNKIIQC